MFIKEFEENKVLRNEFRKGFSILNAIGFLPLFMEKAEVSACESSSGDDPIKKMAIQCAWQGGYMACLKDMYALARPEEAEVTKPRADFGSAKHLLETKAINESEYKILTGRDPIE